MNIQTEHLDNHTARLTVAVDPARVETALRDAARRLAKKGRIPGFRPGKAPLNVVLNLYGREYVLGEAIDALGNEIYREALDEAEIAPYAPGSLEDFKEEDGLTLTFIVPKQPTVDLGGYRDSVRVEFQVPEVTDEDVEKAMEGLREGKAVLEDVDRPAEMSDLVTLGHIAAFRVETGEEESDEAEAEEEETEAEAADEAEASEDVEDEDADDEDFDHDHEEEGEMIMHEHDYQAIVRDDANDLFPGFSQHLVGATAGDELEFTLVMPEDYEDEELAGQPLRIEAHVAKVQSRAVAEWSDALAEEISDGEIKTIDDLRVDVRRRLEEATAQQAENELIDAALDQLVEGATIKYPAELVDEYVDDMINEFDMSLRRGGLNLEDFLRITGQSRDAVAEQYKDPAERRAQRALALGELVRQEQIALTGEELDAEIDRMSQQLGGEQSEQLRALLNTDMNRSDISNRLVSERAMARLAAIAKGENPPVGMPQAEATSELAAESVAEENAAAEAPSEPVAVEEAAPAEDAEQPAEDTESSE